MPSDSSQLNHSFFYDVDNITVYFSYFSEFNRRWEGVKYLEACVMCLLFVIAMFGNSLILGFVWKYKKARTVTNYFVCNLAMGDIMYALTMPLVASVRITDSWNLGHGMCHLLNYWMCVCSASMIWIMVAISTDRYICIHAKSLQSKRLGPMHVVIICAGIWIINACCFLPTAFFFLVKEIHLENDKARICTLVWPNSRVHYAVMFTSLMLIFCFGLPVTIMAYNYYKIFKKFWSSKTAVGAIERQVSRNDRGHVSRRNRDIRVVKTLVLLVALFVIMWLPIVISFSVIRNDLENGKNEMPSYGFILTLMIAYLNPCINPFLYGVMNVNFLRKVFPCFRRHIEPEENTTVTRMSVNRAREN